MTTTEVPNLSGDDYRIKATVTGFVEKSFWVRQRAAIIERFLS
jgi:hypothetical protein